MPPASSSLSLSQEWVATVASGGLFVGTALLSRWWMQRHHRRRVRYSFEEAMEDRDRCGDRMDWYRKRRNEDRLSYHDIHHLLPPQCTEALLAVDSYEGDYHDSAQHETVSTDYSNWNHFEGFSPKQAERQHRRITVNTAGRVHLNRAVSYGSDTGDNLVNLLEGEDLKEDGDDGDFEADGRQSFDSSVDPGALLKLRLGDTVLDNGSPPTAVSQRSLDCSSPHECPVPLKSPASKSIFRSIASLDERAAVKKQKTARRSLTYKLPLPPALLKARRTHSGPELADAPPPSTTTSITTAAEELSTSNHERNREARTEYNASIMPDKLVLIRHGQSLGNIDESLYATTPDNAMPLTELGWEQAREAGRVLKKVLSATHNGSSSVGVHFIISPYVRTVETFHGIVSAWCDPSDYDHVVDREQRLNDWYGRLLELGLTWHEDPRIREQDFGNYQEPTMIQEAKRDRNRFGAFYYRFPHGESASDVFDRVSTFLDSLWRSFDTNNSRNYVLVTHGISIRVILARYFRYTIDQFHLLANPRNCEMVLLGHDGAGRLELGGRYELELTEHEKGPNAHVIGYKFHQRLRVLPKKSVNTVHIRMRYGD